MPTKHMESFQMSHMSKLSKIFNGILIPGFFIVLILMLGACGSYNPPDGDSTDAETPDVDITVKIKRLTEEEAIKKIKYELEQSRKTMIVEVHY